MQDSCRADVCKYALIVNRLVGVERTAVTLHSSYKFVVVVLLTLYYYVKIALIIGDKRVQCCCRKAPCPAHGIILNSCAGIPRHRKGIFIITVQFLIEFFDDWRYEIKPFCVIDSSFIPFAQIRFQDIIRRLTVDICAVTSAVHTAVPPAMHRPYAALYCIKHQPGLGIGAALHSVFNE